MELLAVVTYLYAGTSRRSRAGSTLPATWPRPPRRLASRRCISCSTTASLGGDAGVTLAHTSGASFCSPFWTIFTKSLGRVGVFHASHSGRSFSLTWARRCCATTPTADDRWVQVCRFTPPPTTTNLQSCYYLYLAQELRGPPLLLVKGPSWLGAPESTGDLGGTVRLSWWGPAGRLGFLWQGEPD